jgi:hypothetical protein
MESREPWYLQERAEALAMVAFTRLPGVSVEQPKFGDLNLLVTLPSRLGGRVFGLEVKGVLGIQATLSQNHLAPQQWVNDFDSSIGEAPFPIGLLVFDMANDCGYFGWYLEPSAHAVRRRAEVELRLLDDALLHEIVGRVEQWYDARVPA